MVAIHRSTVLPFEKSTDVRHRGRFRADGSIGGTVAGLRVDLVLKLPGRAGSSRSAQGSPWKLRRPDRPPRSHGHGIARLGRTGRLSCPSSIHCRAGGCLSLLRLDASLDRLRKRQPPYGYGPRPPNSSLSTVRGLWQAQPEGRVLWVGRSFVRSPRLALGDAEDLSDVGPTVPGSAQPLDFLVDQPRRVVDAPEQARRASTNRQSLGAMSLRRRV